MKQGRDRIAAFLIECSEPSWLDVARHLGDAGIDIRLWVGWAPIRDGVEAALPDTLFHDTIDAKRAIPHQAFAASERALFTQGCRTIWEKEAQTIYEMMIRFDHGRDLIYTEASLHLYKLLIYWNDVLDRMAPDVVIFPTAPHVVYDYVILCLCEQKNIRVLIFEQAWIYPPYSMLMHDFRDGSPELSARNAEVLAGPRPVSLSAEGRGVIDRLAGHYADGKPPTEAVLAAGSGDDLDDEAYLAREDEFLRRNAEVEAAWFADRTPPFDWTKFLRKWLDRPARELPPYEKQVNVTSLAKQRGESLRSSFEGELPNTRYLMQRREQLVIARARQKEYRGLCSPPPEAGDPFIFLPMMFQPERTSCPQGGLFSNQLIMVNMLSHLIPENWLIYVKEHPTQLHPNMQSTQARPQEFYAELVGLPNVRLIDRAVDPFGLIDRCAAVATVGGTAAIEAVVRGKPVLVFGHAYYNDCSGMHTIDTEADLVAALGAIREQPRVDRAGVEAFFHAIETSLFSANADANLMTQRIEGNAEIIAREIAQRVRAARPSNSDVGA